MLSSEIPARIPLPFADSGTKNAIPTASQIGITPGAASLTDGFPPLTFTPIASGGIPPAGADFNGILNMITAVQQWQSAGGIFKYDATFSTAIGGYPAGAVLMGSDNATQWLNLADNNTTDPETSPANWAALSSYGITAVTGLTNTNVTLTPAQYGKSIITLAGTLTGNIQIVFPTTKQKWLVVNNTTGAFTVTCKTAAGTGGTVTQGGQEEFYGDGTNLVARVGNTPAASDNSAKLITSAWAKLGFSSSLTTNGYMIFPSWLGGWVIQWGTISVTSAGGTFNFPVQFPTSVFVIVPGDFGTAAIHKFAASTLSTSQFNALSDDVSAASASYIAIGK
jgi:hypothetical protein